MLNVHERKRRVLELLTLGGLTRRQAAEAVGVGEKAIGGWLRNDPEFKRQLEEWRTGPPPDALTLTQARRIIIDELARRVLHERSKMTVRELMAIGGRLDAEAATHKEEKHDDDTEPPGGLRLTPEQVDRIWAEIERTHERPEADAAERQG